MGTVGNPQGWIIILLIVIVVILGLIFFKIRK